VQEGLSELKKSKKLEKSTINKILFVLSEEKFLKDVIQLLEEVEYEITTKVDVVATSDLKSEFVANKINALLGLLEKIQEISNEYPLIEINRPIPFYDYMVQIQFEAPSEIQTSDDFVNYLVKEGWKSEKIEPQISWIRMEMDKVIDSEVYMRCLSCTSVLIIITIQRIISENKRILTEKYDILEDPPFIISREQQKVINKTPKTFEEVFYNIDFVNPCIDILKELKSPFVDTDYNYIGKLKGIYCIWIEELTKQGIIKGYSERKIYASLIPTKIKGFSIDESMFGKYHKRAENYRLDIKSKISIIKLSQVSQKEN
jgi:hypothetical protein